MNDSSVQRTNSSWIVWKARLQNPIGWMGLMLVYGLCYFFIDRTVSEYFYHHPWPKQLAYLALLGKGWLYVFMFMTFALVQYVRNDLKQARLWLWLAAWVCYVYSCCGVLKVVFGRARPWLWLSDHRFGFYGWQFNDNFWSFPSGHVTVYMALALGASWFKPRYTLYFFLGALALSALRVIFLYHFVSDVLATSVLVVVLFLPFHGMMNKFKFWEGRV